jgi:AcrR family transcriptional regulator
MTDRPETPLRADARRNRELILQAAKRVFAEQGPDASVEEIARAAGLGVGTLYRRFPDRESLVRAVGEDNLTNALREARAAVAEEPTAWAALVRILRPSQEVRLSFQLGMASPAARAALSDDPGTREQRRGMLDLLDEVVHAAQAEGSLRADIDTGDVAMVFVMLVKHVSLPRSETLAMATDRCMALMLDGLRARPDALDMPGTPLTRSDLGI